MAPHQPIRKSGGSRALVATTPPGDIPDKLYFRIGEVARLCEVPAYVLRFWESEFPQFKPNKGGTGQRLFRRRDVEIALRIKCLLYDEGYTIPGARQLLKAEAKAKEPQLTLLSETPPRDRDRDTRLHSLRQELGSLLALLQAPPGSDPGVSLPHPAQRSAAPRRTALIAVPASDRLFDFPGTSTGEPAASDPLGRSPSEPL